MKVDLEWDDNGVVPEVVYPDTTFVFTRMTEATLETVAVGRGEMVLDIGCGRACDAIELAKRGAKVIGLEVSRVMIRKARGHIANSATEVTLVQGVAESLPFKTGSFDRIMCKGALDHFFNPSKTLEGISRVLKPGGQAVISIANFESLSCRLARAFQKVVRVLFRDRTGERLMWEIPTDHTYKFDYPILRSLVSGYLWIEEATGVSLLWGLPFWGWLLSRLPKRVSAAMLLILDQLASRWPAVSDVLIMRCRPGINGQRVMNSGDYRNL